MKPFIICNLSIWALLIVAGSPRAFSGEPGKGAGQVAPPNSSPADPAPLPHEIRFDRAFSMISSQKRKLDPFMTPMNEEEARKQPVLPEEPEITEPQDTEDLLDTALQKLTITGIMPRTGTVLIGGRSLKVGQTVSIRHDENLFRLRLNGVSGKGLEFTDLDSGRMAALPLNIMPLGMTRRGTAKRKLPSGAQRFTSELLVR